MTVKNSLEDRVKYAHKTEVGEMWKQIATEKQAHTHERKREKDKCEWSVHNICMSKYFSNYVDISSLEHFVRQSAYACISVFVCVIHNHMVVINKVGQSLMVN